MRAGARSALTIVVLGVVLVLGAFWGWTEVTKPFPGKADAPVCVDTAVKKGEKVYPSQVVVSVLNAGGREGLAGRTMEILLSKGFVAGDSGNAPRKARVGYAVIWTSDPKSPAVRLVASWIGHDVRIVRKKAAGNGVVVVVGDGFQDLVKGRAKIKAKADTTICSPPVD